VCALTAGHVIRYGNGAVGTKVVVDGHDSTVIQLLNDYDLALIDVPPEHATLSVIGCARFGPAELIMYDRHIDCRVVDTGRNLNRFAFPCADMPLPGDSGAPIVQEGRVINLVQQLYGSRHILRGLRQSIAFEIAK
jgi:hypothetical protein